MHNKMDDASEGLRLLAQDIKRVDYRNKCRQGKFQGIYSRLAEIYILSSKDCIAQLRKNIKQLERLEKKLHQHKVFNKPTRKRELNNGKS